MKITERGLLHELGQWYKKEHSDNICGQFYLMIRSSTR